MAPAAAPRPSRPCWDSLSADVVGLIAVHLAPLPDRFALAASCKRAAAAVRRLSLRVNHHPCDPESGGGRDFTSLADAVEASRRGARMRFGICLR